MENFCVLPLDLLDGCGQDAVPCPNNGFRKKKTAKNEPGWIQRSKNGEYDAYAEEACIRYFHLSLFLHLHEPIGPPRQGHVRGPLEIVPASALH